MATISDDNIVRNIHRVIVPNQNVYQFAKDGTKALNSDTVALVSTVTGQSYTYHEFWSQVDTVSDQLLQRGFQEGQVMAIFSPNCPEYLITLFAVWKAEGIVACFSPLWTKNEVAAFFRHASPTWVLANQQLAPIVCTLRKEFNLQDIIVTSGTYPSCVPWADMTLSKSKQQLSTISFTRPGKDWQKCCALIMSSSGTTGLPKAVALSHSGVAAIVASRSHPSCGNFINKRVVFQPLSHVSGMVYSLIALSNGSTAWLLPSFNLKTYLDVVSRNKIPVLNLMPSVLIQMVKSPLTSKYDLSHVTEVTCGAGALGADVFEEFMNHFSKNAISRQGYGLTETASAGTAASEPGKKIPAGTIGLPVPNVELRVIDPTSGQTLGPKQRGEICIRGPTLMIGYVGNPRATKETIDSDHWLHTGDMGYFDKDGYFYFVERIKELIKYSSYQVAPAELESLLLTHPAVAEVGVFGLPDPIREELPTAWVVLKEQYQGITKEDEIIQFVAERVAHYKRLRGGVKFVTSIPKSHNGKIMRRKMREDMLKETANSKL